MKYIKHTISYKGRRTYGSDAEAIVSAGGGYAYINTGGGSYTPGPTPSQEPTITPSGEGSSTITPQQSETYQFAFKAYETSENDTPGHWTANVDTITNLYDGLLLPIRISTNCFRNNEGYNTLNVNDMGAKLVWFDYNKPVNQEVLRNDELLLVYRQDAGRFAIPSGGTGELVSDVVPGDGTVRGGWVIVSSDELKSSGGIDLTDYYTRYEVDTIITDITNSMMTSGEVITYVQNYLAENNYIKAQNISYEDYLNMPAHDANTLYITGIGNFLGDTDMCCGGGGGGGSDYWNVSPTAITAGYTGLTTTVRVMSNTAHTMTTNESWIHITPVSGLGYQEYQVVIDANNGHGRRNGEITVGDKMVVINQYGNASPNDYLTMEIVSGGSIVYAMKYTGGDTPSMPVVEYSLNGGEWTEIYDYNSELVKIGVHTEGRRHLISVQAGDLVRWRGNHNTYQGNPGAGYATFGDTLTTITGNTASFNLYGNLGSLVYGSGISGNTISIEKRGFANLFAGSDVIDASGLFLVPISQDTITDEGTENEYSDQKGWYQYSGMFEGCEKLIYPPYEIPSDITSSGGLGSCAVMFGECSSLVEMPILPDKLEGECFNGMFRNCTSLTQTHDIPLSKIWGYGCAGMFKNCTSLVNAPEIKATEYLEYACEGMFSGCTSLVNPPSTIASSLTEGYYACHDMFYGCTSLTKSPIMPAPLVPDYAYTRMFCFCENLSRIECLATDISALDCTVNMTYGVSPTGTFVKKSGANWQTGYDGIPSGWTVETV